MDIAVLVIGALLGLGGIGLAAFVLVQAERRAEAEDKRVREWWVRIKAEQADLFDRALSHEWGTYAQLAEVKPKSVHAPLERINLDHEIFRAQQSETNSELQTQLEDLLEDAVLAEDWQGPTVG